MEELIEKLDNLKKSLDKDKRVISIKESQKEVLSDKDLMDKINKYKLCPSEKLKEEIYSNKKYQEYKEKETDLNILILEINQRLKKITDRKHCL